MSIACVKCGSPLLEGQSFCTVCGTRAEEHSPAEVPRFCTDCGAPVSAAKGICGNCGASANPERSLASAESSPSFSSRPQVAHPRTQVFPPQPPPPAKAGSKFLKLVMIAAALFVLFLLLVMGSCAYIAYRAKQRINKVEEAYNKDDLSGMVAAATGQTAKPQPLPNWKPASPELTSSPAGKIPLRKSLQLVHAGTDELRGDFESIFVVDKVTAQSVHIHASQQFPSGQGIERLLDGGTKNNNPRKIECGRTVFLADMETSSETDGYMCREGRNEQHPGTTAMSLSRKTLNELKTAGQSEFTYHEDPLKSLLKSFKNAMASDSKGSDAASQELLKKMMNFAPEGGIGNSSAMDTPALKCTLRRNGNSDVAFPVLVNDQPTDLPVVDVVVKLPDKEGHLYVLDDPDNPLVLAGASTDGGHEQVIKIYWEQEERSGPNQLEQELEKNGRAKVYDIYFDFASATLRPESGKVLSEIDQAMRDHPDWKLSVEGHTDNIGGDSSNLDLSKRRAAAVVQSLIASYSIPEKRFATAGFGASRPVDTNDTPEGRARNRRVELVRQ
jgi:outer membrane protein OmpA-like peptidoglycan-associated protein